MIENVDTPNYKSRVVGYGVKLRNVRTPDGVLHIDVRDVPNCTWALDGDAFYCTHDETEIVDYTVDYMTFDGPDQYEVQGYACAECGESLDGSPAEDRAEALAESQLMEMLGK